MQFNKVLGILLSVLAAVSGCGPSEEGGDREPTQEKPRVVQGQVCGVPLLLDVSGTGGRSLGYLEVANDSSRIWLSFAPAQGGALVEANLYLGPENKVPRTGSNSLDAGAFPLDLGDFERGQRWQYHQAFEAIGECPGIAIRLGVKGLIWADDPERVYRGWARPSRAGSGYLFAYCTQQCDVGSPCLDLDETSRRTLDPMHWAESPRLDEAFAQAFPSGLTIGCNRSLTLEEVNQVRDSLATKDDLLREMLALKLTLQLRSSPQAQPGLSAMAVNQGPFAGWLVSEVLEEAESVWGECLSNYSASQMAGVLSRINRSFPEQGEEDPYLTCPE